MYKVWQVIQIRTFVTKCDVTEFDLTAFIYYAYRKFDRFFNLKALEHKHWLNLSEAGSQKHEWSKTTYDTVYIPVSCVEIKKMLLKKMQKRLLRLFGPA